MNLICNMCSEISLKKVLSHLARANELRPHITPALIMGHLVHGFVFLQAVMVC